MKILLPRGQTAECEDTNSKTASTIGDAQSYTAHMNAPSHSAPYRDWYSPSSVFQLVIQSLFGVASVAGCSTTCFCCILAKFIKCFIWSHFEIMFCSLEMVLKRGRMEFTCHYSVRLGEGGIILKRPDRKLFLQDQNTAHNHDLTPSMWIEAARFIPLAFKTSRHTGTNKQRLESSSLHLNTHSYYQYYHKHWYWCLPECLWLS